MNKFRQWVLWLAVLLAVGSAQAAHVLCVNVHGYYYDGDGANLNATLLNAGATTTFVDLDWNGEVAGVLAQESFDQIWVFDLSYLGDDYPLDWAAIADWYNNRPDAEIICDGRIISSYWYGRWTGEGQNLTENYLHNLEIRGGGLLLGTDHYDYHSGINAINAQIGLNPFFGGFSLYSIPVDTNNPLMNTPNNLGTTLFDDSTPGQTPYGLQPSGQILYTVAWHSGNPDTPGISSTIEGGIGFHTEIVSPLDGAVFQQGDLLTLEAAVTGGNAPYTFAWSYGNGTPLGTGQTLQIAASDLPTGLVTITVLATDDMGRVDNDSVTIEIASTVGAEDRPGRFALEPAYPNPFNPSTTLAYTLSATGPATLRVFDLAGQEVAQLVSGLQEAGRHEVRFDAGALPSGVYLARLVSEEGVATSKLVLVK
ncbi:MAG: T9SS type A sorting domain-containing protein [Candidatus Delongbacteria bacterium]